MYVCMFVCQQRYSLLVVRLFSCWYSCACKVCILFISFVFQWCGIWGYSFGTIQSGVPCLYLLCVYLVTVISQSFYLAVGFHVDSCPSLCMKIVLPTWFLWLACVFGYMSSVYLGYIYEVHFHCSIFFVLKVVLSTCLGCDACLYGSLCIWTVFIQFAFIKDHSFAFIYYIWNIWWFFFFFFKKDLVTICSPLANIASVLLMV